jgi:hypothetical protein
MTTFFLLRLVKKFSYISKGTRDIFIDWAEGSSFNPFRRKLSFVYSTKI